MLKQDHYLILGISREETHTGIRRAFRRLVKRYHPDMVGPRWTAQYQRIVEAYQVLSDPEQRRSYNRGLDQAEGRREPTGPAIVPGYGPASEPLMPGPVAPVRGFQTSPSPFEALAERFLRNFTGKDVPKAERPESLTAEIILSRDEALRGGRLPLTVPVAFPCPACDGTGVVWPFRCSPCGGRGLIENEESLTIQIPAGVRSGSRFEIPLTGLGIHNFFLRVLIRIGAFG